MCHEGGALSGWKRLGFGMELAGKFGETSGGVCVCVCVCVCKAEVQPSPCERGGMVYLNLVWRWVPRGIC